MQSRFPGGKLDIKSAPEQRIAKCRIGGTPGRGGVIGRGDRLQCGAPHAGEFCSTFEDGLGKSVPGGRSGTCHMTEPTPVRIGAESAGENTVENGASRVCDFDG